MPPVRVSFVPFFLACVMASLAIIGTVAVALLLHRPSGRKGEAASRDVKRSKVCDVYTPHAGDQRCGIKSGNLWSHCNDMSSTPSACQASSICGVAANGTCIATSFDANASLAACSHASVEDCKQVQFPSCCQCDCDTCENDSGCDLGGLTAACARAVTPDQCRGAGAACKWYC